jgi:hypothetical protein
MSMHFIRLAKESFWNSNYLIENENVIMDIFIFFSETTQFSVGVKWNFSKHLLLSTTIINVFSDILYAFT